MANLNEEKLDKQQEKYNKEMTERKEAGITQKEPVKLSVSSDGAIEEAKPKRTRKRRTKKQSIDTEPIEKLLITTTGIIATRPDMGMWKMTKQEAHAIAEPLGQVLEKYDLAKPITDNAPELSLLVAVLGFTVPRAVMTISVRKEKNKDGFKGKAVHTGSTGKTLDENRKSEKLVEQNDRKRTAISSTDAIFGSPL